MSGAVIECRTTSPWAFAGTASPSCRYRHWIRAEAANEITNGRTSIPGGIPSLWPRISLARQPYRAITVRCEFATKIRSAGIALIRWVRIPATRHSQNGSQYRLANGPVRPPFRQS
jgi:hypothetical protein